MGLEILPSSDKRAFLSFHGLSIPGFVVYNYLVEIKEKNKHKIQGQQQTNKHSQSIE